jgi:RNA polymerase sigma-70 factor (ECF subfamily)
MSVHLALATCPPAEETRSDVTIRRTRSRGNAEPLADVVLVERAGRGDSIAFSELVNRHYPRAVRVAIGMVRNKADAEDIAQEAFARVHRKLPTFNGNSAFYTWLYRIVVNLSIDALRRRKRQRLADGEEEVDHARPGPWPTFDRRDPRLNAERRELSAGLQRALDGLPEIHRAVLILRELEGMSYQEIADAVGIKKGTVMSRLFHARRAMQQELASLRG